MPELTTERNSTTAAARCPRIKDGGRERRAARLGIDKISEDAARFERGDHGAVTPAA